MLTQKRLKELLSYDSETGLFTGLTHRHKVISRKVDDCGHKNITVDNKPHKAHRLAWLYVYGEIPIGLIDHRNGIADDNRITNLRLASNTQNLHNQKIRSTNTSGYKGVSWSKQRQKWQAQCCVNYITTHLGYYDTPEEASEIYNGFVKVVHGEFYRDTTK